MTTTRVHRVQLDMPQKSYERLGALKLRTEAGSHAEVIKNALRLYEAMIERHDAGARFFVRDQEGGAMTEYMVL
ncbi:MAG: ribbon-helix-helix protein, CopG family [Telluria sp.]